MKEMNLGGVMVKVTNYLVLTQRRQNPDYNDIVGKTYHFPQKYLNFFKALPIEFIYYEPVKQGIGGYFGKGKIEHSVIPDRINKGFYFVEISSFTEFDVPIIGHREKKPFYNPQNAVRKLSETVYNEICSEADRKNSSGAVFSVNSHVLRLLGDQLIGKDDLAVFELVKNSYDADATDVAVIMDIASAKPKIVVHDNGSGMTKKGLVEGWLTIGGDLKRGENKVRTPVFRRYPLGDKGVGRLAAFKIGDTITLTTRASGNDEYELTIDMQKMTAGKELSEAKIPVLTRSNPEIFTGDQHGTKIEISQLRNPNWTRRDVRNIKRMVNSLCSPFQQDDSFNVNVSAPTHDDWLQDMFSIDQILNYAVWQFDFTIDENGRYNWEYKFIPPSHLKELKARQLRATERIDHHLELFPRDDDGTINYHKSRTDAILLNREDLRGIGPIQGKVYVFHRRLEITNTKELKKYLDEQTGIKVYRDNMRVHRYGDPGNDWLGLDAYRINRPGERLANNSVVGMVALSVESSEKLQEKTNREGFDETEEFLQFRRIILSIMADLDLKRLSDRKNLVEALKTKHQLSMESSTNYTFEEAVSQLEDGIRKHNLYEQLGPKIVSIKQNYNSLKDVVRHSGMAGLNLSLIFHEVERGVLDLDRAVKNGEEAALLMGRVNSVVKLLDGFAVLLRNNERKQISVKSLLTRAKELNAGRFRAHKVVFECSFLDGNEDSTIYGSFGMYLGVLNNLIDNAIYWTRIQAEVNAAEILEQDNSKAQIAVLVTPDTFEHGVQITVLDTGPGFSIDPQEAFQPFVTSRLGGMGLGLYYAKLVMESEGGDITVGRGKDFDAADGYSGAAVTLSFRKVETK